MMHATINLIISCKYNLLDILVYSWQAFFK